MKWCKTVVVISTMVGLSACASFTRRTEEEVQGGVGAIRKFRKNVLSTKVTCSYHKTDIIEVLQYFSEEAGVTIAMDERTIHEGALVGQGARISLELEDVTFHEALAQVLRQLDLVHIWDYSNPRAIWVSSPEHIIENLQYPETIIMDHEAYLVWP